MDKSCKNCIKRDNCTLLSCALTAITNFHEHGFYCCDYEPKKKTVKLYAYLKEDDGHELIWHTNRNLRIERFTRVPSEDKEIQI